MKASIVGLGYVGLPLACECADEGLETKGIDVDEEKLEKIKNGVCPVEDEVTERKFKDLYQEIEASKDYSNVSDSDVIVVTVPTPVSDSKEPNYDYVESAMESISENISEGTVVILESTVAPGTSNKVVRPILEQSGYEVGEDIYLAYCPERIDPGNEEWTIKNIPRVLGAYSEEGLEKAEEFYSKALEAEINTVADLKSAEASKVVENSFRDINIAFVNELAKSFDSMGIDTKEVIEAASSKPFGFMPHWPGCGVGGHCIPVDPYYLIDQAETSGFQHEFMELAREINNSMPEYTVEKLQDGLNKHGKPVNGTKIALLGLAYKGGVGDTRESPALEIRKMLEEKQAEINTFDPYVPEDSTLESIEEAVEWAECVVIATEHEEFKEIEKLGTENLALIIDGKNILDRELIETDYLGVGR